MSLRTISLRPNPKPLKRKKRKAKRARKVKHRSTAHGYLVQGCFTAGRIFYLAEGGKWTMQPDKARRFHTLKLAREACHSVGDGGTQQLRWVQPVPA